MNYIPRTIVDGTPLALALEPTSNQPPAWIVNAILAVQVGNELAPRLHATPSVFRASGDDRNRLTTVLDNIGAFTFLTGSWTTEFYVYNHSPDRLVIIYRPTSGDVGWYDEDRDSFRTSFF